MSAPVVLTTQAIINGKTIQPLFWKCHLTSYGNLCMFELKLATAALKVSYPDIFKDQDNTPEMECKIIINDQTNGVGGIIFDGIVDEIEGTWEDDEIEVRGRDYSALLRDQTATLDQYLNQTVSAVVQGIASQSKLQTNITNSSMIAGIRASTYQGEDWAFSKSPRPLWHIVQQLADEAGYVAYVDQHKVLNFVAPGQGGQTWKYTWRPTPAADGSGAKPLIKLNMIQQSRRCNNFTLRLHGYDPNAKQTIFYELPVGTGEGKIVSVNRQDLNSQNYQQIAQNLAAAIQRKNIVGKILVEGNFNLNLNDQVQISEAEDKDLLGLANQQLFIVAIVQQFSMPDYGSAVGDGFYSHLTLNQVGSSGQ